MSWALLPTCGYNKAHVVKIALLRKTQAMSNGDKQ